MLIFFANWQSQAARLIGEQTRSTGTVQAVADYVCRMHDRIIDSGFYEDVQHQPDAQVAVEVACALEGLADAYALVRAARRADGERYRSAICTALQYLIGLQATQNGTSRERGGFGMSLADRTQRIDVTGMLPAHS